MLPWSYLALNVVPPFHSAQSHPPLTDVFLLSESFDFESKFGIDTSIPIPYSETIVEESANDFDVIGTTSNAVAKLKTAMFFSFFIK